MSIEGYLAVNLVADFALLAGASRALGVFRWRRVLAADALCAGYAVLAAIWPVPWASVPVQLALLALVALMIADRADYRSWRVAALSLAAWALVCGGIALPIVRGPVGALAGILAGTALLCALYGARSPADACWQVRLGLRVGDKTARFPALIDTGNRLREPVSGQPVVIAEVALLRGLLPEGGYRVLRFGALGGNGDMACFKPTDLWIERGLRRVRAPDVWVAVAPGPLPGQYGALAPGEFALCTK